MTIRITAAVLGSLLLTAGTALAYAPRPAGMSLSTVSRPSLVTDCSPLTAHCSSPTVQPSDCPTVILILPPTENPHNLGISCGNNPVDNIDPLGLAVGDWWDPRTYVFNPIGMSGPEASERARISRAAIDKAFAFNGGGDMSTRMAFSMLRELHYSRLSRLARRYDSVGQNKISLTEQIGAEYEADGSIAFEYLPIVGSGYKAISGEVIDDRADGIRELSDGWRAGYGTLATVEGVLVFVGPALAKGGGITKPPPLPETFGLRVAQFYNPSRGIFGPGASRSLVSKPGGLNTLVDALHEPVSFVAPRPASQLSQFARTMTGRGNYRAFVEFDVKASELASATGPKGWWPFSNYQKVIPGGVDLAGRNAVYGQAPFNTFDALIRWVGGPVGGVYLGHRAYDFFAGDEDATGSQ